MLKIAIKWTLFMLFVWAPVYLVCLFLPFALLTWLCQ